MGFPNHPGRSACRFDRPRSFAPLAGRHLTQRFARMMKALVYLGPGKKSWEEHAKPKPIEPTDAIVRVTKTALC